MFPVAQVKWATHEATLLLATVASNKVTLCMVSSCAVVCYQQQLLMNTQKIYCVFVGNIVARNSYRQQRCSMYDRLKGHVFLRTALLTVEKKLGLCYM